MRGINCYYVKLKTKPEGEIFEKFKDLCSEVLVQGIDDNLIAVESRKNYEFMFLFWDEIKSQRIINFFERNELTSDVQNVSQKVLDGTISMLSDYQYLIDEDYNDYKSLFTTYATENMTVNDVLDKISKYGMKSLNDTDKAVLRSCV